MAYGARTLYPKFSNNNAMLHLGTREIQLVTPPGSEPPAF